ncbi:MAG: tRNA (adenosine(37)-N6)-threonylcarbamoyltransferase complex dimerization subunit type 1 TsaB [Gemmatimonadetes bacterium]|nr:tRNA (adenosine(37)-N6)-threonylcarbamoyltransferase complex dimerization subunit type 1 TsaB [Gemmatimonadota bacterium]
MSGEASEPKTTEMGYPCLALVTCGPQLEVALAGPSLRVVSLVRLAGVVPRSTLVLAAADLLVEDAGIAPDALRTIVVSRGPGSFTGIRAGLATAAGLVAAAGAECHAYDSLLMQAARCDGEGTVWSAQPGRRGEVYTRAYRLQAEKPPQVEGEIEIVSVASACERGPWAAAEALDLGGAERAPVARGAAEALLRLSAAEVAPGPPEPIYVEGPPVHRRDKAGS